MIQVNRPATKGIEIKGNFGMMRPATIRGLQAVLRRQGVLRRVNPKRWRGVNASSIHMDERKKAMKAILAVMAAAATLAAGAVQAQDVLKAKGCLNCHDMDKKKVGPAYKDVAAKYKGNKDAEGMLVTKIKEGKGHPKVAATEDELKAAIKQVLATK